MDRLENIIMDAAALGVFKIWYDDESTATQNDTKELIKQRVEILSRSEVANFGDHQMKNYWKSLLEEIDNE